MLYNTSLIHIGRCSVDIIGTCWIRVNSLALSDTFLHDNLVENKSCSILDVFSDQEWGLSWIYDAFVCEWIGHFAVNLIEKTSLKHHIPS
jgi:hypothetical protein